jgi:hypothetical protein
MHELELKELIFDKAGTVHFGKHQLTDRFERVNY